jgi:hypothetical protein
VDGFFGLSKTKHTAIVGGRQFDAQRRDLKRDEDSTTFIALYARDLVSVRFVASRLHQLRTKS